MIIVQKKRYHINRLDSYEAIDIAAKRPVRFDNTQPKFVYEVASRDLFQKRLFFEQHCDCGTIPDI